MTATNLVRALLLATLASLASTALHAQSYNRQQLQDAYAGHLRAEQLAPEINSSGNVRFRREGRTYVIHVDERDPLYFRLTMAFASDDKSADMRRRRLEGCNTASAEVKVVKCFLDEDGDPVFASEMFLIVPGDFKASFTRLLRAMDSAYDRYNRRLTEAR
jgi:hypothetical protein